MKKAEKLKKVLKNRLKENVRLKKFTTMKVGGVADYYFEARNIEDLISSVIAARVDKIPFFILGGGSNVIISDYGYGGLIIRNKSSNISILPDKSQIIADSGVELKRLILKGLDFGLGGMEKLYGIYGTVGGAVYGNAGAYMSNTFDFVKNVTMLTPNNKLVNKNAQWFDPGYRITRLKESEKKDYVILTVRFQLAHNKKEQLLENIKKIKTMRDEKFSQLGPSCGSIFRNPNAGKYYKDKLLAKKNSAGYLLDKSGVKELEINDAQVYDKHANIVHNRGKATSFDIRELINQMKEKVKQDQNINLKEEVEYIGQWKD